MGIMKIKEGKNYHIRVPELGINLKTKKPYKIHIDKIIPNPKAEKTILDDLVIYRVWIIHKRYWKWYVNPYWTLAIWNEWEY